MIRNYNQIEIYNIEKEFKMICSHNNSYEINDIDFYEILNYENDGNIIKANSKSMEYNIIFFDVEQNIYEYRFKSATNKMELNFKININDIGGINNDMKMKGLFNFDFPYFIKNSPHYIALTTDQTCFLFKKEK